MPVDDQKWFLRERSEALAGLFLTSQEDVEINIEKEKDDGVDFYVSIHDDDSASTKLFVVQVRGTTSSDRRQWTKTVKQLFKGGAHYLPVCVFVVNVRENNAAYAWVAEPTVEEKKSAKLSFYDKPDFNELNQEAASQIIDQVRNWYDNLPPQLVATSGSV